MSWVKLDDQFADHPKVAAAGPLAAWTHVKALVYCGRYLTDGFVPEAIARSLVDWSSSGVLIETARGELCGAADTPKAVWLIDRLVDVGLWDVVEGGYQIHDYLDHNPSRESVLAERDRAKQRRSSRPPAEERSSDVRPTRAGRSPDVRQNISGPVPVPVPDPLPDQTAARSGDARAVPAESVTKVRTMPAPPAQVGHVLVTVGMPITPELREAARMVPVQDIDGAWLKFCGHYNGQVVDVVGKWALWCGNEKRIEDRDRARDRPRAKQHTQPPDGRVYPSLVLPDEETGS